MMGRVWLIFIFLAVALSPAELAPQDLLENSGQEMTQVSEENNEIEVDLVTKDFTGQWKLVQYQPRHVHIAYGGE